MTSECSTADLADMVYLRVMQEAKLMTSSTIQSISTTLTQAARHLNEMWNSRQPLFKLPPEILTRIVNDALPWSLDEPSYRHKNPAWRSSARATEALLPITHTCRWLRQAVINDSTLWRSITTDDPQFLELLLSRNSPISTLTLTLSPRGNPPRLVPTDFQHFSHLVPRLQELHLLSCIQDGSQAAGLKAFLNFPLPQLQYFSLTSSGLPMAWNGWNGVLPLSAYNAPNVRYLHLQMVLITPDAPFPCLTHLSLWDITRDSLDILTNVLRNCPALTSLVFRRVLSLRRFFSAESVSQYAVNTLNPPFLPYLSRVIFADMEWYMVHYYALLFFPYRPCIQVVPTGLLQVYPAEIFESLYLSCVPTTSSSVEEDTLRLSIAVYAFEDTNNSRRPTMTSLSIMLATSTRLVRITLCPYLLGRSYSKLIGPRWRDNVLTPLRTLPGLRELWLTDTDTDTDVHSSSAPLWDFPTPDGARDEPAVVFPSLESVVVVYDCSAALRRLRPDDTSDGAMSIQPSISALPKAHTGPRSTCPNLSHVRFAIGYDPADLPCLRDAWLATPSSSSPLDSARPPEDSQEARGRVNLSAQLLRELACESGEYAYVRRAALRVQLMPHLALDGDELGRLRALFAEAGGEVSVEEIDCLPGMPVPERVRDGALDTSGFVPRSVLC